MTIKVRLIILGLCIVVFLILTPYIVLYSLGYRVDLINMRLRTTGGIYVYAQPDPLEITINAKSAPKTSYFSSAVFVQNLMPGDHNILIKKDGYYDYQKKLEVREKEVTKLENVTLFKKNIVFQALLDIPASATEPALTAKEQFALLIRNTADLFTLKNNIIFDKTIPLIKDVNAYKVDGSWLIWLGTDGVLYRSDLQGQNPQTLSDTPITSAELLKTVTTSPDNIKIAYYNARELWYWMPEAEPSQRKVLLRKSQKIIKNVYWLNNDYLIFLEGNNIIISEIDVRGNINTITLPQTHKNPQIFFSQQDKNLYIFAQSTLVASERLLP